MNVKDVQTHLEVQSGDRLELMIAQQKTLMEKYHVIESRFRLTMDCPVDLDDSRGQLLLKDFAWRTTEEVAEALSALLEETGPDKLIHAQEEIADALHFLLEFLVLSGGEKNLIFSEGEGGDSLDSLFHKANERGLDLQEPANNETLEFIRQLGMVCHTLKNKPWKQTQMLTDKAEFYARLLGALRQFCRMSYAFGMDAQELFDMYFRKAAVNTFRQRSQY